MATLSYNQVMFGFPAYRVFIFGSEVTADVTDVTISWKTGRAPSFATIQLLNLNDKYIYRRSDLIALNAGTISAFANQASGTQNNSSLASEVTTDTQTGPGPDPLTGLGGSANPAVQQGVFDASSVKARVTTLKRNKAYSIPVVPTNPFSGQNLVLSPQMVPIYPIIEGKSCFHQNDPVRIFIRDVFDPKVWYYGFSGFITVIGDNVTSQSLEKVLTITVEDVSKALRYARTSSNPGITNPQDIISQNDTITYTGSSSSVANLSFQDAADFLVFGDVGIAQDDATEIPLADAYISTPVVDPQGNVFQRSMLRTGAGNFKYSTPDNRVFTLGGQGSTEWENITLYDWQSKLDSVVNINDITTLIARSNSPKAANIASVVSQIQTNATVQSVIDPNRLNDLVITEIGGDPFNYPVDGGTLYMLLPEGIAELGDAIVASDFQALKSWLTEFDTRRNVLYNIVDRVEFVFYADPKGNLIIELPLYDFDPDDFAAPNAGTTKVTTVQRYVNPNGTESFIDVVPISNAKFTLENSNGNVTFDNERRFTIEDECVENFNAIDDDAPVRTVCVGSPVVDRAFSVTANQSFSTPITAPIAVILDALIPIYGYRQVQGNQNRLLETPLAVQIGNAIDLNKINSDAYSIKPSILPRFSSWLNRPYLFRHRNHIGVSVGITHKISWASACETSLTLSYMRGWSGQIDSSSGRMIYETIGGNASRPLNYAVLFAQNKTANDDPPQTSSGSGTGT